MTEPIKINSTDVVVIPLFDIQHKETLRSYRKGIRCQFQCKHGLYPLRTLMYFLQEATRTGFFERRSLADMYEAIGYEFGFAHGGVLTSEGTPRADVTTLVDLGDNQDAIAGYKAGRQWFFEEATPDERTVTDEQLIERLRELTKDAPNWHDPEGVWFFTVGCLFGELSGHLFPLSQREQQQSEAEAEAAMKEYLAAHGPDQEEQDSEPSALVSVLEYTV